MTTIKPEITYDSTMYVRVPDKDLLDNIINELYSFYVKGNNNLRIPWEDLTSYVDDDTPPFSPDALEFISEAYNSAEGEIGDVVFWFDEFGG